MGQVTFLGMCSERYLLMEGGASLAAGSLTQLRPSAAFLQPLFLCGWSRDILLPSVNPDSQRSLYLWNGPRLGTKRLTSTAKSAPTPTPSSNRSVRQTSTLTGVLECA